MDAEEIMKITDATMRNTEYETLRFISELLDKASSTDYVQTLIKLRMQTLLNYELEKDYKDGRYTSIHR